MYLSMVTWNFEVYNFGARKLSRLLIFRAGIPSFVTISEHGFTQDNRKWNLKLLESGNLMYLFVMSNGEFCSFTLFNQ